MTALGVLGLLLLGTMAEAATVTVNWTHDGQNVTAFQIQRRAEGGPYANVGTAPASDRAFTDPGGSALATGNYCWQVAGLNGSVLGPYGPEACGLIPPAAVTAPGAPGQTTVIIQGTAPAATKRK